MVTIEDDIKRITKRIEFISEMASSYNSDEELSNSFLEELGILNEEIESLQEKNKI
jgi:hypothetical protein